jgi:septal ring factor EnvC (AmiA/AmiB activator)
VKGSLNSASHKKRFSSLEVEHESLKMKVDEVTADRDLYKNKLEASHKEISDLEDQLASLSAALQEAEQKLEVLPSVNPISSPIVPPGETATGPDDEKAGI